ncbi:MAG: carbon-nitrogen hydrolase family protein [Planctomycetaceae bacterium]|nr:carbon-nitrogen hydrolase family protein [Planctomycetaceae bacterium]
MRIAHCQFEPQSGNFAANLQRVVEGLESAERDRAEIVSFPECFLTGYQDDGERARRHAFPIDSTEVMQVLDATSRFDPTLIVGFNEIRGEQLFNTALVAHRGHLLGQYSKCAAYMSFHTQGREFPVFERETRDDGVVTFGVIICADGGYIEPTRILTVKGARVIFAPHYNYIGAKGLISHFMRVRADHTARARENGVYFVRGNNVTVGEEQSILRNEGVGYGDSYVIDPHGEIVARTRRHVEDLLVCDIHPHAPEYRESAFGLTRSLWSAREFGGMLNEAVQEALDRA